MPNMEDSGYSYWFPCLVYHKQSLVFHIISRPSLQRFAESSNSASSFSWLNPLRHSHRLRRHYCNQSSPAPCSALQHQFLKQWPKGSSPFCNGRHDGRKRWICIALVRVYMDSQRKSNILVISFLVTEHPIVDLPLLKLIYFLLVLVKIDLLSTKLLDCLFVIAVKYRSF